MKALKKKVTTEAENILDMAETNNGEHTIMIASIDLDQEVDENHKTLYLYTVYLSEWYNC